MLMLLAWRSYFEQQGHGTLEMLLFVNVLIFQNVLLFWLGQEIFGNQLLHTCHTERAPSGSHMHSSQNSSSLSHWNPGIRHLNERICTLFHLPAIHISDSGQQKLYFLLGSDPHTSRMDAVLLVLYQQAVQCFITQQLLIQTEATFWLEEI